MKLSQASSSEVDINTCEEVVDLPANAVQGGQEVLPRCVTALVEQLPVEEVWVFGSCARGEATDDSDVDLLVVLADGHGLARPNLASFQSAAKVRHRPPLDVIAITQSQWAYEQAHPFGLYGEIARSGVKIYARQSA
jgi:predicted nucleotidyltransferase